MYWSTSALKISPQRNVVGERRKTHEQPWSDCAWQKPGTASFLWGHQPPFLCACAIAKAWVLGIHRQSRRVHAHSTYKYQYDGRTFSALKFRSSQHKQGCLHTEQWLEFEKNQNQWMFHVDRSFLGQLGYLQQINPQKYTWHIFLVLALPRAWDGATIHRKNISRVGSVGVSSTSPICIYPTPQMYNKTLVFLWESRELWMVWLQRSRR